MKRKTRVDDVVTVIAEIFTDYGDEAYDALSDLFKELNQEFTEAQFNQLATKLKSEIEADTGWTIDDARTLRDLFKEHANGVVFPKISI